MSYGIKMYCEGQAELRVLRSQFMGGVKLGKLYVIFLITNSQPSYTLNIRY